MAISVADVDFTGPAPTVKVLVGFMQPASYTIAIVPPDMDLTKARPVVTADEPSEVDAEHSISPVWDRVSEGWFVVVFGGIGGIGDAPQFAVSAILIQQGSETPMTVSLTEASAAATFVAAVELK